MRHVKSHAQFKLRDLESRESSAEPLLLTAATHELCLCLPDHSFRTHSPSCLGLLAAAASDHTPPCWPLASLPALRIIALLRKHFLALARSYFRQYSRKSGFKIERRKWTFYYTCISSRDPSTYNSLRLQDRCPDNEYAGALFLTLTCGRESLTQCR